MFKLKYDLVVAVQAGYPDKPEKVMKDLGYTEFTILNRSKKSNTLFIEVSQILHPLPPFLEDQDIVDGRIEIDPEKRNVPGPIELPGMTMHFHQDPLVWTFNFGPKGGKPE